MVRLFSRGFPWDLGKMLLFLLTEDRKLLSCPCSSPLGRSVLAGGGCFEGIFGLFFWFGAVFERFLMLVFGLFSAWEMACLGCCCGSVLCGVDGSRLGVQSCLVGAFVRRPAESSDPSMGEFDSGEVIELFNASGQHVSSKHSRRVIPSGRPSCVRIPPPAPAKSA